MRDPVERAALLEIAKTYLNLSRHVGHQHDFGAASESDPGRPFA